MQIGNILTALRNKKGLTQDQISDVLGVKRARYNSWENNIAKPDIEMIKNLATLHKVSTDYILGVPTHDEYELDCSLDAFLQKETITYKGVALSKEDIEKIKKVLEAII